jgi:hypothetical protein
MRRSYAGLSLEMEHLSLLVVVIHSHLEIRGGKDQLPPAYEYGPRELPQSSDQMHTIRYTAQHRNQAGIGGVTIFVLIVNRSASLSSY